jgi:hypothetical protein
VHTCPTHVGALGIVDELDRGHGVLLEGVDPTARGRSWTMDGPPACEAVGRCLRSVVNSRHACAIHCARVRSVSRRRRNRRSCRWPRR